MSDTSIKPSTRSFTKQAVPLLIEYGKKLNDLVEQAIRLRNGSAKASKEYPYLVHLFERLQPPALQLARQVSQQIEHAKLLDLDRLELSLRLAEFEHALLSAEELLLNGK